MNKEIKRPAINQIYKGDTLKVLQVTGESYAVMPLHYSTKEAVINILEGSAILDIDNKEHLLKFSDSVIIPANQVHSLTVITKMKAIVVMPLDSTIEFIK